MKKTLLFFICLTLLNIVFFNQVYAYENTNFRMKQNGANEYISCQGYLGQSPTNACVYDTRESACSALSYIEYSSASNGCVYKSNGSPFIYQPIAFEQLNGCENGTMSGSECTCNEGYTDTGSSCQVDGGGNDGNGGNCSDTKDKIIIRSYTAAENCGSVVNDLTGCDIRTPPSFDCVDSCQYDFKKPAVIHSCGASESDNRATRYCSADFVGTGNSCGEATITTSGNEGTTPESTTPHQSAANNSGGSSNSNHNSSNPSTGGSGTSGTSGTGSSPNGSSGSGSSPSEPNQSYSDGSGNNAGSVDCPDCATEATQREVLKALTNTEGGTDQPDVEEQGFGAGDVADKMVSDDRIKSLFKFTMPSHSRICPTAEIDLTFDLLNLGLHQFDSHCQLLEPNYNALRGIAIIAWLIMSMVVLLKG